MNWPELGDMVQGPRPGRDGRLPMAVRIAAFEDVGRRTGIPVNEASLAAAPAEPRR